MKFGQLIKYNQRSFFFEKDAKNEARRLVYGLSLFYIKIFI